MGRNRNKTRVKAVATQDRPREKDQGPGTRAAWESGKDQIKDLVVEILDLIQTELT